MGLCASVAGRRKHQQKIIIQRWFRVDVIY